MLINSLLHNHVSNYLKGPKKGTQLDLFICTNRQVIPVEIRTFHFVKTKKEHFRDGEHLLDSGHFVQKNHSYVRRKVNCIREDGDS